MILLRANEQGEILDAEGKVVGVVVPIMPTEAMIYAAQVPAHPRGVYTAMLAARPDLSAALVDLAEPLPRYIVEKMEGSHLARVIDTQSGEVVKQWNVLACNGWALADAYCKRMNEADPRPPYVAPTVTELPKVTP